MNFLITTLFCLSINLYRSAPVTEEVKHVGLKCIFQNNFLNCGDQIHCAAVSNIAHLGQNLYNSFGIGALPQALDYKNLQNVVYDIYPKVGNSIAYLNNTIQLEGNLVELHLYFSLENTGYGIHVIDGDCYAKLVSIFRQVNGVHYVKVKNGLVDDGVEKVDLIGEVVIKNRKSKKFMARLDEYGQIIEPSHPWIVN